MFTSDVILRHNFMGQHVRQRHDVIFFTKFPTSHGQLVYQNENEAQVVQKMVYSIDCNARYCNSDIFACSVELNGHRI